MKTSKLLVAAFATAMSAATAGAQQTYTAANPAPQTQACTGTTTTCTLSGLDITLGTFAVVNDVLRLSVNNTVIDLGTPLEADFDAGKKDASGSTKVTIKSNRPYTVSIGSEQNFLYAGSLAGSKVASDLLFGTTAASRTTPLGATTSLITTATGVTGTQNGQNGEFKDVYFATKWDYAKDKPGNYSLDVKFTVSAP